MCSRTKSSLKNIINIFDSHSLDPAFAGCSDRLAGGFYDGDAEVCSLLEEQPLHPGGAGVRMWAMHGAVALGLRASPRYSERWSRLVQQHSWSVMPDNTARLLAWGGNDSVYELAKQAL